MLSGGATKHLPVNFVWFLLVVILCSCVTRSYGEKEMLCYQCEVDSNELCTDEYLKPCPSEQAYDRCMTVVRFERGKGTVIRKTCALGPCELRDESHSNTIALGDCDRSKDEYTCVGCCRGDGCNKSSSYRLAAYSSASLLFLFSLSRILNRMVVC